MRINGNFVLQEVADEYIVVPVGQATEKIHGVIKLNTTGAFLWKKLEENDVSQEDLLQALLSEYSTDSDKARDDVEGFIQQLSNMGCLL